MKVLVTGGAGFIGSTIASRLLDNGDEPIIIDNFLTGREEFVAGRVYYEGNVGDRDLIRQVFLDHPDIEIAIHCAARIVVPESVSEPIRYYEDNVVQTLHFVEGLLENGCTKLIFSSSASIYVPDDDFSVDEDSATTALSPYARTKVVVEDMLKDITVATPLKVMSLRYFNPVGADPQFRTGLQVPKPSHALGKIIESSSAGQPFTVTGVDYSTRDGSGIRDYVHVWDLASAHALAVHLFDSVMGSAEYEVINLGTGRGTTVKELVTAYESVVGHSIQVEEGEPRPGDVAGAFTRSSKAKQALGWSTTKTLEEGIADTLKWFEIRENILGDLGE